MKAHSLFVRFSIAAAVLIILALTLAGLGLRQIFNQEIERRVVDELGQIVKMLAAQVRIDEQGMPALDASLPDPRFDVAYGGIYWQIEREDGRSARSRSLWDFVLSLPDAGNRSHPMTLDGPNGSKLLSIGRRVFVPSAKDEVGLLITAALDRNDLLLPQQVFSRLLVISLVALGAILIIAMIVFIRLALRPFDALGRELKKIHGGAKRELTGDFPREVQPVINDLNKLIRFHDAAIDRARVQASDLAHGLKTPLAVLNVASRQAAEAGYKDITAMIDEQTTMMRRHVDRVLARTRAGIAATLGRKAVAIAPVAEKVVRAFKRLPEKQSLTWECNVPSAAMFPGEEGDLVEILGNLLDNARKWGKGRIRLTVLTEPNSVTLHVEDDGPGISSDAEPEIARGRRWDEAVPGTGFGLAITRDLVDIYRGELQLGRSDLGGVSVSIKLPITTG